MTTETDEHSLRLIAQQLHETTLNGESLSSIGTMLDVKIQQILNPPAPAPAPVEKKPEHKHGRK